MKARAGVQVTSGDVKQQVAMIMGGITQNGYLGTMNEHDVWICLFVYHILGAEHASIECTLLAKYCVRKNGCQNRSADEGT